MGRRDFTVNAMARRLETGEILDPFHGAADLKNGVLRTVRPRSFAEDPLRLVRGTPPRLAARSRTGRGDACARCARRRRASRLVSAERVGGGLHAGRNGRALEAAARCASPRRALRLARDTGVLTALLPEFEPAIGFEQSSDAPASAARRAHLRGRAGGGRCGRAARGAARRALARSRQAAGEREARGA